MGELYVVRHGQASFHSDHYDKLSELGERQARYLGQWWARHGITFDHIFSGPLDRQRHSAELLREGFHDAGLPYPDIRVVDGLAEMDAEAMAKTFLPTLCERDPAVLADITRYQTSEDSSEREEAFQRAFETMMDLWVAGEFADPAIETWDRFFERVTDAFDYIRNHNEGGQRIVAVCSGGPIGVAMHHATGCDLRTLHEFIWRVRNGSFTEFLFSDDRFALSAFNCTPHLDDPSLWTYR